MLSTQRRLDRPSGLFPTNNLYAYALYYTPQYVPGFPSSVYTYSRAYICFSVIFLLFTNALMQNVVYSTP
jgi:hypothetical protein